MSWNDIPLREGRKGASRHFQPWGCLDSNRRTRPARTGGTWSQYARLFRRNHSGRLELTNTILIGVIE
jgi:hypothetical protein